MLLPHSGLSFDRPKKQRRERCEPDPEEKKKYQEEANQFAMSLVEGLGDPDGNNIKLSLLMLTALINHYKYNVKLGYVQLLNSGFFFLFTKIINFAIRMSINNVVLSLLTAFNIHFMVHQVI